MLHASFDDAVRVLFAGAAAVVPTDTIYGLVARAVDAAAIAHLYELKGRDDGKPFIILIPSLATLEAFGVTLTPAERAFLRRAWPAPLSVVFPCVRESLRYLHRGSGTLAFRVPNDEPLRALLARVGPLAAPSANPQGAPPATTIAEAAAYFGDKVAAYVDGGERSGAPSTLIAFEEGSPRVLRPGAWQLP